MSRFDEQRKALSDQGDWERVVSAAAHLQTFVPEAVLVGGTAAAIHVQHRFSYDADHIVLNLVERFQRVLSDLESNAGWQTNRLRPPVLILGNLDGIDTGIRNLIRSEPLEVETYNTTDGPIVLPTLHEMTRIKAWLIVTRNATRDYIDFVALASRIVETEGADSFASALRPMDRLYPQKNGTSVILQVAKQLAEPKPKDLGDADLTVYRLLAQRWQRWESVKDEGARLAELILLTYERKPETSDDI